ncbi:MAG: gliding motility protein GldC [Flavobacteriaceae bacterium]|jgi:gliding motility-associated protein GldC|nr:gliding motility protein GldC [Flavobacteriaceae bacterium]
MRKTQITVEVELDENHIPEKIIWNAQDGGIEKQETKAAMISVWDGNTKEALRIDLWTKDMPVDEMKQFFHQIFISLGDTYLRATGDENIANRIEEMAEEFAVKSAIKM